MTLSKEKKLERAQSEMVALETAAKSLLEAHKATRFSWDTLTIIVRELALSRENGDSKIYES